MQTLLTRFRRMHLLVRVMAVSIQVALPLAALNTSRGEDWPQWRGPLGTGISAEQQLPATWSVETGENILWKAPLPGSAGATPVVYGGQIYLTSAEDERLLLQAFNRDGKELWRKTQGSGNRAVRGDEGNLASPSPCTDGKHVWALMGNGILACYTTEGKEVWRLDLDKAYGPIDIQFGLASTPVLVGDRLYLQLCHTGGQHVVALDATTGKTAWHVPRPTDAVAECLHSYASPSLYTNEGQTFLITHGGDYAAGHRLTDGKELWRCAGLNPKESYNNTLRFIATPVSNEGVIIIPSAKNGPVVALRTNAAGDVSEDRNAQYWKRSRETPDVPSPLIHDGLVYLCRENGTLMCWDAQSGEDVYPQQRLVADRHRASPVLADGKLYCTSRAGVTNVIKVGRTFELLATNDLKEDVSASPAVADGRIYLRSFQHLYAIGNR